SPGMPVLNEDSSLSAGPVHSRSNESIQPSPSSSMQFEHCGFVGTGPLHPGGGMLFPPPSPPVPPSPPPSSSPLFPLLPPQAAARMNSAHRTIFIGLLPG